MFPDSDCSIALTLEQENFTTPTQHFEEDNYADYLDHFFQRYSVGIDQQCAFLPSLEDLSSAMDCPIVEVHTALQDLREKGYDFYLMGTDSRITLWYP